ncbi:glucose-methanol-choline oxidoreductase-like protein [Xylariomycetidae sp. FL0641]|nr:glucose-methanol-choline oxidoreductase-like protein [Xylariomycetidae sp. FL0641]
MQMPEEFDFVVVGAGPAGCVIASRLAKSPARPSVLLVEAGGLNEDTAYLSSSERFEVAFREGSPLNWFYKTEPQSTLKDQVIDYSRGRGLGGSTAINFCGWTVGPDDDYDRFAELTGNEAFSWKRVKETLKKVEKFHNDVPEEFRGSINPKDEDHGQGGAVDVSYQSKWLDTCNDLFVAAKQAGLGVNPDVNSGNPIGMGMGTVCVYDGVRVTASSAYLRELPSNLKISVNTHVAKVVIKNGKARQIQAVDGRLFQAKKEVIVSAGALNSPQLLQLSGIGPKHVLEKHGIQVVRDMAEVGENLQDHCMSSAGIVVKKGSDQAFKQVPTPMGWFKTQGTLDSKEFRGLPAQTQEFLNRPHEPNWEFAALTPLGAETRLQPDEEVISGLCMVMNPQSKGTVTLQSSDPTDAPIIDPKFLTHPFDKQNAIESMRDMLRYFQVPVWKQKTTRTLGWPEDLSDQAIWEAFRSNVRSSWHMCGTVRMGTDEGACVDASFKVLGIDHLRVADMSVCPFVPNTHTQTTAYLIGEIAAEQLIGEHQLNGD